MTAFYLLMFLFLYRLLPFRKISVFYSPVGDST
jgi:hypothetical protein